MTNNDNSVSRRKLLGVGVALAAGSAIAPIASHGKKIASGLPAGIANANVSLIASAMGKMDLDAMNYTMSPDIKPLSHDSATMIGPAITCKWEIGPLDDVEDINKYIYDPLDNAATGSVWVIESGTEEVYSMFGDIITQSCTQRGLLGAVTDSGCRDIEEIRKQGFTVFAKSAIAYGPRGLRPVSANMPITCGGVDINPGDLIAADIDGVIIIPKEHVNALNDAVAVHLEYEDEVRKKVEAGQTLRSAYPY